VLVPIERAEIASPGPPRDRARLGTRNPATRDDDTGQTTGRPHHCAATPRGLWTVAAPNQHGGRSRPDARLHSRASCRHDEDAAIWLLMGPPRD